MINKLLAIVPSFSRSMIAFLVGATCSLSLVQAQQEERRRHDLEELRAILPRTVLDLETGRISPHDKTWEEWVDRTGELPPDFESLPSYAELPDPLLQHAQRGGTPITTIAQWREQRDWIRTQFEKWVFGRMPPAPNNLRATTISEVRESSLTTRKVLLEFGPEHRAKLHLELMIPHGPGPFPVFLTNQRRSSGWCHTAVRRGYIACIYNATDPKYGDPDDSNDYVDIWPEYDFSGLARWAWAGMRAVDHLITLPEVIPHQIGITGHSRNGKQALLAAAFDERIGAVVASSGNVGECLPWRYPPDPFLYNALEAITGRAHNSYWFHPRLRFFAGREHKLPVDQHMMLALVAPRGAMMYSAYAEVEGNPWGFEQSYRAALPVFRLLDKEESLWLHLREGEHGTNAADIERFMDFFDSVFQRKRFPKSETLIHGYTFEDWQGITNEQVDPRQFPRRAVGDHQANPEQVRANLQWALGEEPPRAETSRRRKLTELPAPDNHILALLYNRPLKVAGTKVYGLPYGDGLKGELYYPTSPQGEPLPGPVPAVIWLHPEAYARGYSSQTASSISALAKQGFAVAAFDQLGFGTRLHDAREFYRRYPRWSLMGKMVVDTRGVVDSLSGVDRIDSSRITLVGYAMGGNVALVSAALDDRVRQVVCVGGLPMLRNQSAEKGGTSIRYYSHMHGLIPRFGFFAGQEERLPVDFDEILGLVAPRASLIVAPTLDRRHPLADVRLAVEAARQRYRTMNAENQLTLETPVEIGRFTPAVQTRMLEWLGASR